MAKSKTSAEPNGTPKNQPTRKRAVSETTIKKNLQSAARFLNKNALNTLPAELKKDTESHLNLREEGIRTAIYTVWCPDQKRQIGSPTTDHQEAEDTRDAHNEATGHNSMIIDSHETE